MYSCVGSDADLDNTIAVGVSLAQAHLLRTRRVSAKLSYANLLGGKLKRNVPHGVELITEANCSRAVLRESEQCGWLCRVKFTCAALRSALFDLVALPECMLTESGLKRRDRMLGISLLPPTGLEPVFRP